MNNSQFRKLVLDTPARQAGTSEKKPIVGATPSALGSRMRSSIPMTPRSIATSGGIDFARQLAEQRSGSQPPKKFRSIATPKGAKLAAGYIDRTKERISEEEDDKASRVKALEEMMKLQQIDQATFEKLRDEIVGGDIGSVHLVKGLDYKLLERVRRGEDVLSGESADIPGTGQGRTDDEDVEDEFERLEDQEVVSVAREKAAKKGEMAPPSSIPGKKRNRDQILAELKAARLAAKEKAGPSLGAKFKKVGTPRSESRIERDSKGREVLITVDEHGHEKRKVRRVQPEEQNEKGHGLLMPDKDAKPLGMEVPEIPSAPEEPEEDIDIFDEAGDDYDPLAGLADDDDDDSDAEDVVATTADKRIEEDDGEVLDDDEYRSSETVKAPDTSMAPPPRPSATTPSARRNYFGDSKETIKESAGSRAMSDPTILAAIKKASMLNPIVKAESAEEAAREAKRKRMLEMDDRDDQDMDMGFGSSRFADEEDFGDEKIKLSKWGGEDGEGDTGGKGDAKGKRKRGPKKRKGDGNSAADVMKVLERRKAEKS